MAAVQNPNILLYNVASFETFGIEFWTFITERCLLKRNKYDYIIECVCVYMFVSLWSMGVTSWILFTKPQV